MDFYALSQACAPAVHPQTMAAVAHVESTFNPYAIGVVGGRLERQPRNLAEAVATAQALAAGGWNFSLGLAQVNRHQLAGHGLNFERAFDACESLRAGAEILQECFARARAQYRNEQQALQASFSCYYSGNFSRGFVSEGAGRGSYVQRVLLSAARINVGGAR
jgi:type IV secretion system protein VirB1